MKQQLRKISLLLALSLGVNASAQETIWMETFDDPTIPELPEGWLQYNIDGSTPDAAIAPYGWTDQGWITASLTAGGNCVFSYSYKQTDPCDDWLISPAIILPAGTFTLKWLYSVNPDPQNDGYEVKISTTDQEMSSFTQTIYDIDAAPGANGGGFTDMSVDLSAFAGQTIYLAWVLTSTNKTFLLMDDFEIIKEESAKVKEVESLKSLTLYPIPATKQVTLSYAAAEFNSFQITDANGRIIREIPVDGPEKTTIDITDLTNGQYFIQATGASNFQIESFVKAE